MSDRRSAIFVAWFRCSLVAIGCANAMADEGTGAGASVQGGSAQGGTFTGIGGARGLRMTTSLGATLTLTDNVNLSADKQSALIATVTPGIQISGQSGRVRGSLNYALAASFYTAGGQRSTFNNFLSALGSAEVVPNWLFIDAAASISRQLISPFGTQSPDPTLNNANSTQVTTLNLSPHVRGQIAGQVDYVGRAFYTYTSSGTSLASGSSSYGGILSFNGTTRWSRLGWGLNFSYRAIDFTQGRSTFDQLNWVTLRYAVFPDLIVSARANSETSNVTSLNAETHYGYGGGVRWNPSPDTSLIVEYDTRIFGSSHLYAFNYRTPRTVWSISSTQGLSNGQGVGGFGGIYGSGNGSGAASPATNYDLLFTQFASIQPDPVLRAQLVNDFLKANGINPNATLSPNYLPSQVTEQLSNQASVAWLGQRDTAMLSLNQTRSTNLGPLSNPGNDFFNGQPVTWLGFNASWSHRLTPLDSLTASYTQQRTEGSAESTLWSANVIWTKTIGRRSTASLMARHSVQSGTSAYNESALLGTFSMTF